MLWPGRGSHSVGGDVCADDPDHRSYGEGSERKRHVISRDFHDESCVSLLGDEIWENPDTLIKEKGMRILDKMVDGDAEIKSNFDLKRFIRLAMGWELKAAEERNPTAEHVRKFVAWNFDVFLDCSFDSFLRKMMDASRQGFKIAEIVWEIIDHGEWKGMIGIRSLIVRNSRNYSFSVDRHGRIHEDGVVEGLTSTGYRVGGLDVRRLPRDKFVIYTHNALDDDGVSLYGRSDYRCVWRYYYGNLVSHVTYLRASETFAEPPLLMKYPDGLYNKQEQLELQGEIAGTYGRKCTRVPKDIDVDTVETKRQGGPTIDVMEYHGNQISRGLGLGPMMQGAQERGVSMSRQQFEAFTYTLDAIGKDLEDTVVGRQIIRRLVDMNWHTHLYPKLRMPSLSRDRESMARVVNTLVEAGVVDPTEAWIRDWIDIPQQPASVGLDGEDEEDGFPDFLGPDGSAEGEEIPSADDEEEMSLGSPRAGFYVEVREDNELYNSTPERQAEVVSRSGAGDLFIFGELDNGRTGGLGLRVSSQVSEEAAHRAAWDLARRRSGQRMLLCRCLGGTGDGAILFRVEGAYSSLVPVVEVVTLAKEDMVVQTLILSKRRFKTVAQAKGWVRRSGRFKVLKVDETPNSWRFRQRDPADFEKGRLRTFRIADGVKAVWGPLRGS